jgi:hypothetical protein
MDNLEVEYKICLSQDETLKRMAKKESRRTIFLALLHVIICLSAYGIAYHWFGYKIIVILGLFEVAQFVARKARWHG